MSRWQEWRQKIRDILDREAKVRDLVKASLPLWISVVAGCFVGLLTLSAQSQQREDDLDNTRLSSCQLRNSAQEAGRLDNLAILNGLRDPFPDADLLIDALVASQSRPSDVDSDCNGDDVLTSLDYGDLAPADLPAPVNHER